MSLLPSPAGDHGAFEGSSASTDDDEPKRPSFEHIRISSERPFAEVRRKLEGTVPRLDASIAEALGSGDQKRAKDYEENGPELSIFSERDHGALLQIAGRARNALQYDIGNPLTASKMTRHQSNSGYQGCT